MTQATKDKEKEKQKPRYPFAMSKERRARMLEWFRMSEQDVLDKFAALPNAVKVGNGDSQFVYVPGTREKKCLLVAHADTVQGDNIQAVYEDGVFYSTNEHGIGADDRAGIAMLWELRNSGHSLLIPNGEESGCVGSRFLMEDDAWRKIINSHQFAIEMDRMNDSDMAFYGVGTSEFKDWCEKSFPGYKRVHGSVTDICTLCSDFRHDGDEAREGKALCGMNISVGYYNQHTSFEILREDEWERTYQALKKVLNTDDLPRFDQPKYVSYKHSFNGGAMNQWSSGNSRWGGNKREYNSYDDYVMGGHSAESEQVEGPTIPFADESMLFSGITEDIIVCASCEGVMDMSEYKENNKRCVFCYEPF